MSEFKAIETQEELDSIIQKRLERKEREVQEKYKSYLSPEDVDKIKSEYEGKLSSKDAEMAQALEKYKESDKTIADLTLRAETAEKSLMRAEVASESKLPYELASRLLGDTKEEMQKDAEKLASYMKPQAPAPAYHPTPAPSTSAKASDVALAQVLTQLTTPTE